MTKNSSYRVHISQKEAFIYEKESFGYELVSDKKEDDNTYTLVFSLEPNKYPKYKKIKRMEKDYKRLKKKIPVFSFIAFGFALVLLIFYFVFKDKNFGIYFLASSLFFICAFIYAIFNFIYKKINHSEYEKMILNEARMIIGNGNCLPTINNVKAVNEYTNTLKKTIKVNNK